MKYYLFIFFLLLGCTSGAQEPADGLPSWEELHFSLRSVERQFTHTAASAYTYCYVGRRSTVRSLTPLPECLKQPFKEPNITLMNIPRFGIALLLVCHSFSTH